MTSCKNLHNCFFASVKEHQRHLFRPLQQNRSAVHWLKTGLHIKTVEKNQVYNKQQVQTYCRCGLIYFPMPDLKTFGLLSSPADFRAGFLAAAASSAALVNASCLSVFSWQRATCKKLFVVIMAHNNHSQRVQYNLSMINNRVQTADQIITLHIYVCDEKSLLVGL